MRTLQAASVPDAEVAERIRRFVIGDRVALLDEALPLFSGTRGFEVDFHRLAPGERRELPAGAGHTLVFVAQGSAELGERLIDRFDLVLLPPGASASLRGTRAESHLLVLRTGTHARARASSFAGEVRFHALRPMREQPLSRLIPRAFRDVLSPRDLFLLVGPTNGRAGVRYGTHGPDLFQLALAGTPPGNGPALHVHTASDEIFVVLSGRYEIRWGDRGEHTAVLEPYDSIAVPRGTNRTFTNVGDESAFLLPIVLGVSDELEDIVWLPGIERELGARLSPLLLAAARLVGLKFADRPAT